MQISQRKRKRIVDSYSNGSPIIWYFHQNARSMPYPINLGGIQLIHVVQVILCDFWGWFRKGYAIFPSSFQDVCSQRRQGLFKTLPPQVHFTGRPNADVTITSWTSDSQNQHLVTGMTHDLQPKEPWNDCNFKKDFTQEEPNQPFVKFLKALKFQENKVAILSCKVLW